MFWPDAGSPSELSLVGGRRGSHGLTINNSPNSDLSDSGETGLLLEIRILEEGERRICGAAVAGGAMFCMSYMGECNIALYTLSILLRDDLPGGKGGRG